MDFTHGPLDLLYPSNDTLPFSSMNSTGRRSMRASAPIDQIGFVL
jgi:hypothetical protein